MFVKNMKSEKDPTKLLCAITGELLFWYKARTLGPGKYVESLPKWQREILKDLQSKDLERLATRRVTLRPASAQARRIHSAAAAPQ